MANNKRINKIIRVLIASDFFLNSGWGFLAPIFAIFIAEKIVVGNAAQAAEVAGFAAFVYWVTKSFLQFPISKYLDDRHGEKDDFWFMFFGLLLSSLSAFGFLFASLVWHIYLLQALHAFGLALFIPSWNAIFTRHIDKGKEAVEWGADSAFLGLGAGVTGALGGLAVAFFGFSIVFILVGALNLFAAFILLFIHKKILPMDHIFPKRLPFIK